MAEPEAFWIETPFGKIYLHVEGDKRLSNSLKLSIMFPKDMTISQLSMVGNKLFTTADFGFKVPKNSTH